VNIYADLGTWSGFTPFVGAGLGLSRIGIHSFRDMGTDGSPTIAYANSGYTWNVAYALHAGVSWELTKTATIEFAYRYTYLGDGKTGDIIPYTGGNLINNPMYFRDIDSHDLKLGVRYLFATAGYQMQMQVPEVLMRRY
jgi:opacity protein-like surface antigen